MEEEIAALRARLEALETDVGELTMELAASKALEERVLMPLLLRVAGFGHREWIGEALADLRRYLGEMEPVRTRPREWNRVDHWREALGAMPSWLPFPPLGFDEPED